MSMGEAIKTISVVQSIVSLVGLAMVLLMNLLPPLIWSAQLSGGDLSGW